MSFPISKHQAFILLALLFFGFICYIIICADTGQSSHLTQHVRHLPFGDKAGHFILYGLLALLVNLTLQNRRIQIGTKFFLAGSL